MDARKWFASFSNGDLISWWGQYGRPSQAAYYRQVPRRAAWSELKKRGLADPVQAKSWNYTTGWATA